MILFQKLVTIGVNYHNSICLCSEASMTATLLAISWNALIDLSSEAVRITEDGLDPGTSEMGCGPNFIA